MVMFTSRGVAGGGAKGIANRAGLGAAHPAAISVAVTAAAVNKLFRQIIAHPGYSHL